MFESPNKRDMLASKSTSDIHPASTSSFRVSRPSAEPISSTKHKNLASLSCLTTSPSTPPDLSCPALTKRHHHRPSKPKSSLSNLLNAGSTADTHSTILERCRPFDAILNFLPTGLPDKALLKQTILVSTLCVQYLALDATKLQTINPTGTSASRSDPTVDLPVGGAPSLYRRSTSSTSPSEATTISTDSRRKRFSALSFLSSTPHSSIASDEKPTLRRRLSYLLGLSDGSSQPRAPRNGLGRLPMKAKNEEDTRSANSPPPPQVVVCSLLQLYFFYLRNLAFPYIAEITSRKCAFGTYLARLLPSQRRNESTCTFASKSRAIRSAQNSERSADSHNNSESTWGYCSAGKTICSSEKKALYANSSSVVTQSYLCVCPSPEESIETGDCAACTSYFEEANLYGSWGT